MDFEKYVRYQLSIREIELSSLSVLELQNMVLDYLFSTIYQYEEKESYINQVEVACDILESYLEDERSFFLDLIVAFLNLYNEISRKSIVLTGITEERQYKDFGSYCSFQMKKEEKMKDNFLFLYSLASKNVSYDVSSK